MHQKYCRCLLLCYFCMKVETMTDRINTLIKTIGEKVARMKDQLSVEQAKNESFQTEITQLKEQLASKNTEVEELESKMIGLKSGIGATKEQDVDGAVETSVSDEQIDELVKEIEYCIGQLKK